MYNLIYKNTAIAEVASYEEAEEVLIDRFGVFNPDEVFLEEVE